MNNRVDPKFISKIEKFGKLPEWNECFHCGSCTAVCNLTEEKALFPRKEIRLMQMGLKNRLLACTEPWECYYCGDCTEKCPRDANPGELMMTLRRYFSSVYDWTGLAGLFNKSGISLAIAFIIIGLIPIILLFSLFPSDVSGAIKFGHHFEQWAIIGVAGLLLIPAIFRMYWHTILKEKAKVPFSAYIIQLGNLIYTGLFQPKFLSCDNNKLKWFTHLLIVYGYIILLVVVVIFGWLTENVHPVVYWAGYVISAVVIIFTFDVVIGRLRKHKELNKFSKPGDWLFPIWLFMFALFGFAVRLLRDIIPVDEFDGNTFSLIIYVLYLVVMFQWALIIVPFGKWTHFLFRPFALYFAKIKRSAG
ncbi:MAG: 4Fe-4S dicluster domain-containing protein [Bacteroidetes bacterium]|nr:4Fe-4S dicluster domain-containing protein [Bacteroidota bacterium]